MREFQLVDVGSRHRTVRADSLLRVLRMSVGRLVKGLRRHRYNFWQELRGLPRDLQEVHRGGRASLLFVAHHRRIEGGGATVFGVADLTRALLARDDVIPVRTRIGFRLLAARAPAVFALEPYFAAPPVIFGRNQRSAVLVSDTWDKAWMVGHLMRADPTVILTPYRWPVDEDRALRRTGPSRWVLFPWWAPDAASEASSPQRRYHDKVAVAGALGPMYDLRSWCAAHPMIADVLRFSSYEKNSGRLSEQDYFEMLSAQSAVVVAFSEHESMRVPVAKIVEVAAAASLLIAARAHHLGEMGFEDGVNCLIFEGRADFADKLRQYLDNPQSFEQVAMAGRELVRRAHTTSRRVETLFALLQPDSSRPLPSAVESEPDRHTDPTN